MLGSDKEWSLVVVWMSLWKHSDRQGCWQEKDSDVFFQRCSVFQLESNQALPERPAIRMATRLNYRRREPHAGSSVRDCKIVDCKEQTFTFHGDDICSGSLGLRFAFFPSLKMFILDAADRLLLLFVLADEVAETSESASETAEDDG